MDVIIVILTLLILAFIGFVIYFIFKQLEFVIRAINLYEKMITRQDTIIKLLKDIRHTDSLNVQDKSLKPSSTKLPDISEKSSLPEMPDIRRIKDQAFQILKQSAGNDAINFAHLTESEWICVCGTNNRYDKTVKIQNCSNCNRNRDSTLKKYSLPSLKDQLLVEKYLETQPEISKKYKKGEVVYFDILRLAKNSYLTK